MKEKAENDLVWTRYCIDYMVSVDQYFASFPQLVNLDELILSSWGI